MEGGKGRVGEGRGGEGEEGGMEQRLSQGAVSPSLRRAVVLQDGCINLRRRVNK